jgi:tetratricopeptide (TPR) repeat protein
VVGDHKLCPDCGTNLSVTVAIDSEEPSDSGSEGKIDFEPGLTFAGRFTIIERIGAGGMGVVYKAIDTALDSLVALKLIQPALARSPTLAKRFRREVRLTRQITHPNICRVHDIGESDGVLFLSMEWIEGETLQRLLRQTGTLREARALQIAEKIALALEAAHAKDVIHRDLKPANVMVDRKGNVSVLDFGLAVEQGSRDLTGAGVVLGTPSHMSPEQRAGKPVDARADLYTLGLILFEMLTGRRFDPTTDGQDSFPSQMNPVIAPLLGRLLAENPDDRFAAATEVRKAIQTLESDPAILTATTGERSSNHAPTPYWRRAAWVGGGLLALLAAVLTYYFLIPPPPPIPEEADVFYQRGLHYLREESETANAVDMAISRFHRALDEAPDSALIMAALAEAYWTRFWRDGSTAARDEAERWIAQASRIDPSLPELHNARALGFWIEGKNQAAKEELEKALAAKSDFVMAWVNLGLVYRSVGDYASGLEALHRAADLWPDSFHVQLSLGRFHERFSEYEEAAKYYRRATELKPDSAIAWNNLGASFLHDGQFEKAEEALLRSIEIEEYGDARSNMGTALYFLQRFDEAVEHYRRATEIERNRAVHWSNLGDALLAVGKQGEAEEAYEQAAQQARERVVREPLVPEARAEAALFCAQAGDYSCALENAAQAAELQPDNATHMLMYAAMLCRLDRNDEALDWLERAVQFGMSQVQIEARPECSHLEDDSRYRSLLELAR